MMIRAALLFVLAAVAAAGYDEVQPEMGWVADAKTEGGTTTASGLRYVDHAVGAANAPVVASGDTAKVMYKLYIPDANAGRKHIYSQSNPGEAFDLSAGAGSVIKGFDEAVIGMKAGGQRFAYMPHDIAYGEGGQSGFGIPGSSPLLYYLEIASINGKSEL